VSFGWRLDGVDIPPAQREQLRHPLARSGEVIVVRDSLSQHLGQDLGVSCTAALPSWSTSRCGSMLRTRCGPAWPWWPWPCSRLLPVGRLAGRCSSCV